MLLCQRVNHEPLYMLLNFEALFLSNSVHNTSKPTPFLQTHHQPVIETHTQHPTDIVLYLSSELRRLSNLESAATSSGLPLAQHVTMSNAAIVSSAYVNKFQSRYSSFYTV